MPTEDGSLRVALIAGEPSGDVLGAGLMRALRQRTDGRVVFTGVGGAQMMDEGLVSLFPIADLAVMGLVEVLPRTRLLLRRINETAALLQADPPDVAVTIDSPGFTRRVAQKLLARSYPLLHYVAPTVWAWRPGRAKRLAKLYDHLMTVLPFEPPYFQAVGLPTTFVGHPAVETLAKARDDEARARACGQDFRQRHGISRDRTLLAVLPGSRKGEVLRLLPIFSEVLKQLKDAGLELHILVPTVETVGAIVRGAAAELSFPVTILDTPRERYAAMVAADAALAASGTATLELGLAGTPTILAYKVNAFTAAIVRRLIRTPYAGLVNILQRREIMPEFLQEDCRAELILPALHRLLTDPGARQAQIDACAAVATQLGGDGEASPSMRAAETVLSLAARRLPSNWDRRSR